MKSLKLNLTATAMAATVALGSSFAAPETAQAEVSYNVGIHSKYLLRGIGEENDGTAVQGGVDWAAEKSGWYAGWWFSNLGYSYEAGNINNEFTGNDGKTDKSGFENDFYVGYTGTFAKDFGWDAGLIQYIYINVDDSDLTEATGTLTYKDFYARAQYLLTDGWWGNSGDIYWLAGWSTDLPKNVSLNLEYSYYTYNDSDNSELGGGPTTSSGGFRYFNVTGSMPIGKTGADAYVQYTFAGEDRTGTDSNDSMVVGITYGF